MKRLYSFMLSAVIALAASAVAPKAATEVVSPLTGGLMFKASVEKTEFAADQVKTSKKMNKRGALNLVKRTGKVASLKRKAPRRAEGEEATSKFEGEYKMTIGDYYNYPFNQNEVEIDVVMFVEDGEAEIYDLTEEFFLTPLFGEIDEEAGILTFNNMYIGEVDYEDTFDAISFMPYFYNYEIDDFEYIGSLSATYNEATETFEFPTDEDYGVAWPCWNSGLGDSYVEDAQAFNTTAETFDTFYGAYDLVSMAKVSEGGEDPEPGEEETWTSIGMGEWYEGLLSVIYDDIPDGWHWPVEIFESSVTPGLYQIYPYSFDSPISNLLGGAKDSNCKVIVDATDPAKVYITEVFAPYGLMNFASISMLGYSTYGSLKNGVISFPDQAFACYSGGWAYVNGGSDFKIALPGAVVKDYALKATIEHTCTDQPTFTVDLTVGEDIAKLYTLVFKGNADASYGTNSNTVVSNGTEISIAPSVTINTPTERGHYSVMFAGVNADNEVVAAATTYQIVDNENDEDWKVVPETTTKFTEGFLAGMFSDIDSEDFDVELEENVNTPGRFRFEAPYANHSQVEILNLADHSHKHYIYVNAVDPEAVFVEPSALGFAMNRFGGIYAISHDDYGTYANNVIEAPATVSTSNSTKHYTGGSIKLVMTKSQSNIEEISSVGADKVIFDIQGRRVANPTRGLYIINGKKALIK